MEKIEGLMEVAEICKKIGMERIGFITSHEIIKQYTREAKEWIKTNVSISDVEQTPFGVKIIIRGITINIVNDYK